MARKDDNEAFVDPQTHITKFSFSRDAEVDERSRVDSYDELVFLNKKKVMARVTKVAIYDIIATTHLHLKISKDGKARDEAVESLRATNEPMKPFNSGLSIVSEAIDEQRGRKT